jgi:hypothetical protein
MKIVALKHLERFFVAVVRTRRPAPQRHSDRKVGKNGNTPKARLRIIHRRHQQELPFSMRRTGPKVGGTINPTNHHILIVLHLEASSTADTFSISIAF